MTPASPVFPNAISPVSVTLKNTIKTEDEPGIPSSAKGSKRFLTGEGEGLRRWWYQKNPEPDRAERAEILKAIRALPGCEWYNSDALTRWYSHARAKKLRAITRVLSPNGPYPLAFERDLRAMLRGDPMPSFQAIKTMAQKNGVTRSTVEKWLDGMRTTLKQEAKDSEVPATTSAVPEIRSTLPSPVSEKAQQYIRSRLDLWQQGTALPAPSFTLEGPGVHPPTKNSPTFVLTAAQKDGEAQGEKPMTPETQRILQQLLLGDPYPAPELVSEWAGRLGEQASDVYTWIDALLDDGTEDEDYPHAGASSHLGAAPHHSNSRARASDPNGPNPGLHMFALSAEGREFLGAVAELRSATRPGHKRKRKKGRTAELLAIPKTRTDYMAWMEPHEEEMLRVWGMLGSGGVGKLEEKGEPMEEEMA